MATRASAAPSRPPTTASTENFPGLSRITLEQDLPMEPVAPSRTMRLGARAPFPRDLLVKTSTSQDSPLEQTRRDPRAVGSHPGDSRCKRRRDDEAIEAIHQAPMTGNQPARIL